MTTLSLTPGFEALAAVLSVALTALAAYLHGSR